MNTSTIYRSLRHPGAWVLLLGLLSPLLLAEGSNELTPNGSTDSPVMLETGREGFGVFADYESGPNGRLVLSVGHADEIVYFGLSPEYTDDGDPYQSDRFSSYFFRVRRITDDGTNPVVHGPFRINNSLANVNSQDGARFGNYDLTRTENGELVFVFEPGQAGRYIIEFQDAETDNFPRVNIPFWDITVTRNGVERPGRLWSRNWAFRTPPIEPLETPDCVWNRPFNGDLYSYTADGFVSRIDFNQSGMQGLSFTVSFNDNGPGNTGDLAQDRMSIPGVNATQGTAQHLIFLNLPDPELFPDGVCGEVTTGRNFKCDGDDGYCLDVSVTRPGQVEVILDFNNNGVLDPDSLDRVLVYEFTPGELSTCISWDGLRADGTPVTFADTVDIFVTYAQGVQHWSAYDVEFMKNGFCVETIRPVCAQELSSNFLYWDDRNIPEEPGTNAPKDQRLGCLCDDDCRTWTNFNINTAGDCNQFQDALTTGYGDKNTLNTYWFANSSTAGVASVPIIASAILGPNDLCIGDTVSLSVEVRGLVGQPTFVWSGPGVDGQTTESVGISQPGEYCVVITDETGCSAETCTTVEEFVIDDDQFPDTLIVCAGTSRTVPEPGDTSYTYQWEPDRGIDDDMSNQPTFSPTKTTTYRVTVTAESVAGQSCSRTEEVMVIVVPDLDLQVTGGGLICAEETTIFATTSEPAEITLLDAAGNLLAEGNQFTVSLSGYDDYLVRAESPDGCVDTVRFSVSGGPTDFIVPDSVVSCIGEATDFGVRNLDANDTLTYAWAPVALFDPTTVTSPNPVFTGDPGIYEVTVTATNQFGCPASDTLTLIALEGGEPLAFTAAVDCRGNTVQFTQTSGSSFGIIYDFGDGNTSTEPNPIYTYAEPGTYTVTLAVDYDQECVAATSQQVTALASVLEADFDVAFGDCTDGVASLAFTDLSTNATGTDLTYAWTFTGTDQANSAETNPTVTVSQSGTVTAALSITSADSCTTTRDTTVTVAIPMINPPAVINLCPGDTAALNPDFTPGLTYAWSPAPDFSADDPNPLTTTAGVYSVTVTTDEADFNCSAMATVTVNVADSIGLVVSGPDGPVGGGAGAGSGNGGSGGGGTGGGGSGGNGDLELPTIVGCGEPTELTVSLDALADVDVTYTRSDGTVIGTGDRITLTPNGRDTITVTATNDFGCVEAVTLVIVNGRVDAIPDVGSAGVDVCAATDTTLAITNLDPADTLSFQWMDNAIINGDLDGASVDITAPDSGEVDLQVLVTNQFGCDTTLTITVRVTPFTPNAFPPAVRACFDEATVINGGTAVQGYVYEWDPADGLDLTDPANPVGTFTEDTDLRVTVTDPATGCSDEQVVAVTVAPEISLAVSPGDTTLCEPGTVELDASAVSDAAVIVWYADAELTQQLAEGPTYTVDAPVADTSITVYAAALDTMSGCSQSRPVTVNVARNSLGFPLPAAVACAGDTVSLFGTDGPLPGLTYTYAPAGVVDTTDAGNPVFVGTASTDLEVTITDPGTGCSSLRTVAITVQPAIALAVSPGDTSLCEPGTVVIGATSPNANATVTYYADADLTDSLGTGDSFTLAASVADTTYTVFASAVDEQTGCAEVRPVTVVVSGLTVGLPLDELALCAGDPGNLFGPGGPSAGLVYDYTPADVVDLSDPANPVFVGTDSTTLTVTATDTLTGCSAVTEVSVTINDLGDLSGSADPETIVLGQSSTLSVEGCDDCTYAWFPPNGTVTPDDAASVVATPAEDGVLLYEVEVSRDNCTDLVEIELRVEPVLCDAEQIYLPNAFTPNGDNINDLLRVRTRFADQLSDFEWIIFDRWGQEVFSTTDITDSWDGTTQGDDLEPDVYGFWMRVLCPGGQELVQQGNVTLVR